MKFPGFGLLVALGIQNSAATPLIEEANTKFQKRGTPLFSSGEPEGKSIPVTLY
jgi:hypothetical protein